MIAITLDLEWSPSDIIEDTLQLLSSHGTSATLFSTHDDGFEVARAGHERGLHPNFLREGEAEADELASVSSHYPGATGVRSHCLYVHSRLRELYCDFGLEYESNYMMYRVEGISPFEIYPDIVQFPVYFMDDMWLRRWGPDDPLPDVEALLSGPGLKVFDFHPPHVYYNTPSIDYYERHKDAYWDETAPLSLRYEGTGVRDLFVDVLDHIRERGLETALLGDLSREFRNEETRVGSGTA